MPPVVAEIESAPIAEMNTTPLIDVLLVLLVMFIITVPMQTHAVKIDLPKQGQALPQVRDTINRVTINTADAVQWNGETVDLPTLAALLEASKAKLPQPELHVQPDALSHYDRANQVLAVIKRSGVGKVGLVGNERFRDFPR